MSIWWKPLPPEIISKLFLPTLYSDTISVLIPFSGFSGLSGYSGFSGVSGFSGFSGQSGFSGFSGVLVTVFVGVSVL